MPKFLPTLPTGRQAQAGILKFGIEKSIPRLSSP
jgi:hypothetical protein